MPHEQFEIVLARTAGFCMGVRRAVGMVLQATEDPRQPTPIRTHGPLIHNRQVLEVLQERGVESLDDPGRADGTIVVRAHGLPRLHREGLEKDWEAVLDATCPHVRRVQEVVRQHARDGYTCLVVGDEGHAEVEGVLSYADGAGHVVPGPEGIDGLPPARKVVVVAQTTQDEEVFRRTVRRARERFPEVKAYETICRSTQQRQSEVRELAPRVDAMVVVGGFNSANTRRLAEISAATGTPTYHVETEWELDADVMLRYRRVGLTAGASTPNWMIRRVVRRLEREHRRRTSLGSHLLRSVTGGLVNANVVAAGGAAALTYACATLLGGPSLPLGTCMAVSFFFVMGQHLLNQFARRESLYLSEPDRADFFAANAGPLLALGAACTALAVFLAYFLGWMAFGLVLFASAAGLLYRFKLPRPLVGRLGFQSLEQLPGSKELFVGLAWAAVAAVVPALAAGALSGGWQAAVGAFVVAFLMASERTLELDLEDVKGDRIVGRETLAAMLGVRRAETLVLALVAALGASLAVGAALGTGAGLAGLPLLAVVPYAVAVHRWAGRQRGPGQEFAELAVDGQFYVAGIAVLAWQLLTNGA